MTKEQKALLEVLKFYFWGEFDKVKIENSDISLVMDEAITQGVFNIFARGVLDLHNSKIINFNDAFVSNLKNNLIISMTSNADKIRIQKEIFESFINKNITGCILKGTSLSSFYKEPIIRHLGDLDVLVNEKDLNIINDILLEKGFIYEKSSTNYHIAYIKNAYEIEIHKFVAGLPGGNTGKKMKNLDSILNCCEQGDLSIGNYMVPSSEDNGFIQILHILHHTADRGLKLRLICDWMMYVNKYISNSKWDELKGRYQSYGLDSFACLLTALCTKYLGMPDTITWGNGVEDKKIDMYLEYIFHPWEKYTPIENINKIDVPISECGTYMYNKKGIVLLLYRTMNSIKLILSGKKSLSQVKLNIHNRSLKKKKIKKLGIIPNEYIKDYIM